MITVISGAQGTGKTQLAYEIAKRVSAKEFRGQHYPDQRILSSDTNIIQGVPTFEDLEILLEKEISCKHLIVTTRVHVNRFDVLKWVDYYRTQVNLFKL